MTISTEEKKFLMRAMFDFYEPEMKQNSINIQKEWNSRKGDITISTSGVIPKKNYKKVKIIPIGLNNLCFQNTMVASRVGGYDFMIGYNITACPCGKKVGKEPHFCNKKGDEYFDFTRDFNGEKYKWFEGKSASELCKGPKDFEDYISNWLDPSNYKDLNYGCNCDVEWSNVGFYGDNK